MKHYEKLGKLPLDIVNFFKQEILKRKTNENYQWIFFDSALHNKFNQIFSNNDLKVQYNHENNRLVQKAFYSNPGYGAKIHRDGIRCKSALNIAISCNETDWVRWYDTGTIEKLNRPIVNTNYSKFGLSRKIDIQNYENVPYIDELYNEIGDVYVLDVDTFHSFKCIGLEPRIIIQTKFENFPDFKTLLNTLLNNSFNNLIDRPI
jgi:hypothetical protein